MFQIYLWNKKKMVSRNTIWHHKACRVMTNGDLVPGSGDPILREGFLTALPQMMNFFSYFSHH